MTKVSQHILPLVLALLALLSACNNEDTGGYPYRTRYLPVQLAGSERWSLLNVETGEVVARNSFATSPSAVVCDMFYVQQPDGTYNFYNVNDPMRAVNSVPYGSVTSFGAEGYALASTRGGSLTLIDKQCHVVKELAKDIAQGSMMTRGRIAIEDDRGNWGFIDERGEVVVPLEYANVNAFLHDDATVVFAHEQDADSAATFMVIDRNGKQLYSASTATYRLMSPYYSNGVLPAIKGDSLVCLDHSGKEVANPNANHAAVDSAGYDDFTRTPAGLFLVMKKGKMGLVDKDNKVLIEPTNDRLFDITPTRYIAMNDTLCRIVDEHGKPVGDATFVHAHGSIDNVYASRGFIDLNLVTASILSMFGAGGACGASPTTTLMDMNAVVGEDARPLVGRNTLTMPQGPCIVQYLFNNDIASLQADSTATFNYGARVMAVSIAVNVSHCATDVEQAIVNRLSGMMGRKGFVFDRDGMFTADSGTAIALGYGGGNVNLYYYMNRNYAQPLPRITRK